MFYGIFLTVFAARRTSKPSPPVTVFFPVQSIPTSSKTRNTSTVHSATQTRQFASKRCGILRQQLKFKGAEQPRYFTMVCRWLQLPGDSEHPAAQRMVHEGAAGGARRAILRAATPH